MAITNIDYSGFKRRNDVSSIDALDGGYWLLPSGTVQYLTDKPTDITNGVLYVWKIKASSSDEYFTVAFSPKNNAIYFRAFYGQNFAWIKLGGGNT